MLFCAGAQDREPPFWSSFLTQVRSLELLRVGTLNGEPFVVPSFHPATQNGYLLESCCREHFRSARRALLGSSIGYYRLPLDLGQLSDFCGEFRDRNVARVCDMAERPLEFFSGAHVYQGHFSPLSSRRLRVAGSVKRRSFTRRTSRGKRATVASSPRASRALRIAPASPEAASRPA